MQSSAVEPEIETEAASGAVSEGITPSETPQDGWPQTQTAVIWKGVETVLRHMIGLLDKIDAGVEGIGSQGGTQVSKAIEAQTAAIDRMRRQVRESIDRMDHQLVLYASQSTAEQQDVRRQLRAIETRIGALTSTLQERHIGAPPAWAEAFMARIEARLDMLSSGGGNERLADLDLRVSAIDRKLSTLGGEMQAPEQFQGAAQEIRLLLAELIAIQERDQKHPLAAAG